MEDYEAINMELSNYSADLAERPQIVIATKLDALDDEDKLNDLRERVVADRRQFLEISAVARKGLRELIYTVAKRLEELQKNTEGIEFNDVTY